MQTKTAMGGAVFAAMLATGTVLAAGVIVIDGTVLTIGKATARGAVVLDPDGGPGALPEIAAPVGPGTAEVLEDHYGAASRDLPTQRGGGSQAFHATSNVTLSAGTYDYSSITIDPGVQVTCSGAVLLRAKDDVLVEGSIRASGGGAGITILCGGDFTARAVSGYASPRLETGSFPGTLAIDAMGDVVVAGAEGADCWLYASEGVFLSARGTGRLLDVSHTTANAGPHGVYLRSEGDVVVDSFWLRSSGGGMYVASFGGDARIAHCDLDTGALGIRFDAQGSLTFSASSISGNHSHIRAADGAVTIDDGTTVEIGIGGPFVVLAGTDVSVTGGSSLRSLSPNATAEITTYGGDLVVGGDSGDASLVEATGRFGLTVRTGGGVSVASAAAIRAIDGGIAIDAAGGSVASAGEIASRFGAVEIRASGDVEFTGAAVSGTTLRMDAGGAAEIAADAATADDGPIELRAAGDVMLRGTLSAAGGVTVVTTAGTLDASGAAIETRAAETESGSILLECWKAADPSIDLTGAALTTGAAADRSGDIVARIRTEETADGGTSPGGDGTPTDGTPGSDDGAGDDVTTPADDGGSADSDGGAAEVLPDNGTLEWGSFRARRTRGGDWTLHGNGRLAADIAIDDFGGAATLVVGGESRALDRIDLRRRGSAVYAGDRCSLRIRPSREDGRFRCEVVWRGDVGALSERGEGSVRVRVEAGGVRTGADADVLRSRTRRSR